MIIKICAKATRFHIQICEQEYNEKDFGSLIITFIACHQKFVSHNTLQIATLFHLKRFRCYFWRIIENR